MKNELHVLFEDNHLLVVNKPALLPTMGVKEHENSLVTMAKQFLKRKYSKPGNVYLGVVSRLDSFVSGVVVLAKTSKAAARLNQQFSKRLAQKKYLAIVPDFQLPAFGEMEHWIAKDESQHRMMTVSKECENGKHARLKYKRIGKFENQSLLLIELLTGRKHQIRVQLSATGLPIIGDRKYGSNVGFERGIALHSYKLSIEHPTLKKVMDFECRPPDCWRVERFGF